MGHPALRLQCKRISQPTQALGAQLAQEMLLMPADGHAIGEGNKPLAFLERWKPMQDLKSLFASAVKDRVGSDPNHGWGVDDSAYVIETLVTECMPDGTAAPDDLMGLIRHVINPSAFRQILEKQKRPDGTPVLKPSEGKRASKTTLINIYGG